MAGPRSTSLVVTTNDPVMPMRTAPLSCNGRIAELSVSASSRAFGDQRVGTTSAPFTFTISNGAGAAPLTYSISGAAAPRYTLTCPGGDPSCLARTLAGYEAWVTGVRRDEAPTRTTTPLVTFDEKHGLVKVNPLVTWSLDDVTAYATEHRVPVNLLLSEGYPSIGCEPCTRQVAPGDDPRSGRWAGLSKTECGIHE